MEFKEYTLSQLSKDNKGTYGIGAPAVEFNKNLYTYLRITDINEDGTLNYNNLKSVDDENADKYLLEQGDIVFARTGNSTGKSYYYDGEICNLVYAGFLIKFSLDDKKVNPKYIKYYTMTREYKNWVKEIQTGSTRGNINEKMYGNMKIKLPPREYQDKMVNLLDKIDKKIKLNNQTNDNLFNLGDALYKELYENKDKITNDWKICKLIDVAENYDAKRKPMSSREREEHQGKYPYYGATSIIDYVEDYIFDGTYLLMGEDGTVVTDDNKPVLQYIWGKNWVNNHAHILRGTKISTEHLMFCLRNTNVRDIITGAVQPKINQENMNNIKIIFGNKETNQIFEKTINSLMKHYKNNIEENKRLTNLRDTLLPKLMNREINLDNIKL